MSDEQKIDTELKVGDKNAWGCVFRGVGPDGAKWWEHSLTCKETFPGTAECPDFVEPPEPTPWTHSLRAGTCITDSTGRGIDGKVLVQSLCGHGISWVTGDMSDSNTVCMECVTQACEHEAHLFPQDAIPGTEATEKCGWSGCPTCDPEGAVLDTWTTEPVAGNATKINPADFKHGDLFDRVVYEEKRSRVVLAASAYITSLVGTPISPALAALMKDLMEAVAELRAEAVMVAEDG